MPCWRSLYRVWNSLNSRIPLPFVSAAEKMSAMFCSFSAYSWCVESTKNSAKSSRATASEQFTRCRCFSTWARCTGTAFFLIYAFKKRKKFLLLYAYLTVILKRVFTYEADAVSHGRARETGPKGEPEVVENACCWHKNDLVLLEN